MTVLKIVTTLSLKKETDRQQQKQITYAKNQINTKLHKTTARIKKH